LKGIEGSISSHRFSQTIGETMTDNCEGKTGEELDACKRQSLYGNHEVATRMHLYVPLLVGETDEQAKDRAWRLIDKMCDQYSVSHQIYEQEIQ